MYAYFEVENYRCLRTLELDDLARVNLVTGVNDVGKTALLEALFLHCGAYDPSLAIRVDAFRRFPDAWVYSEFASLLAV